MTAALVVATFGTYTTTLNVAANPPNAFATGAGGGSRTTNAIVVSTSGGVAPLTYAWTIIDGDTITINSPTVATTTFTGDVPYGEALVSTARCTITDAVGSVGHVDVGVTMIDTSINFYG